MDERTATVNIGGQEYEMLLTTRATKAIAGRYGGLENLGEKLMKAENFEMALDEIVWLITLLCNQPILVHNLKPVSYTHLGGYLVPDEYERTLVEALEEENVFRQLARVIQTSSGDRKIPVVATKGTASWIDEEGAYTESDDSFGQVSIGAYKLGTMIKVSEELLNDLSLIHI